MLMRRARFREASAEEWTPGHMARLRWVQRELRRLRLESGKRFQQGLVGRIREAWRERDFALAHRLIHRLAGTGLGPKRRATRAVRAAKAHKRVQYYIMASPHIVEPSANLLQ